MWPPGQTQPCPFPGPSPCMAVQANCFSKGLKTHSALSHCRMGTFSGVLLGMLAHLQPCQIPCWDGMEEFLTFLPLV